MITTIKFTSERLFKVIIRVGVEDKNAAEEIYLDADDIETAIKAIIHDKQNADIECKVEDMELIYTKMIYGPEKNDE